MSIGQAGQDKPAVEANTALVALHVLLKELLAASKGQSVVPEKGNEHWHSNNLQQKGSSEKIKCRKSYR